MTTPTFDEAVLQAHWWTRFALDIAPGSPAHPGVMGHLKAADVQLVAVENLSQVSSVS